MTSKTTNKFSTEVRARAVRMVLDHESEHPSRWTAVSSIAAKIGCSAHTLPDWVKKAEVDSGKRAGVPIYMDIIFPVLAIALLITVRKPLIAHEETLANLIRMVSNERRAAGRPSPWP